MKIRNTPFRSEFKERKGVFILLLVFFSLKSIEYSIVLSYRMQLGQSEQNLYLSESSDNPVKEIVRTEKVDKHKRFSTSYQGVATPGSIENEAGRLGNLNEIDSTTLKKVRGIGPVLASRIVRYRNSIQGFDSFEDLYRVYGLDSTVIDRIRLQTTLSPKRNTKLNLRTASAKELGRIPYLSKEDIEWLLQLRDGPEGLGDSLFLTNLLFNTLNKNKKLLVYLTY